MQWFKRRSRLGKLVILASIPILFICCLCVGPAYIIGPTPETTPVPPISTRAAVPPTATPMLLTATTVPPTATAIPPTPIPVEVTRFVREARDIATEYQEFIDQLPHPTLVTMPDYDQCLKILEKAIYMTTPTDCEVARKELTQGIEQGCNSIGDNALGNETEAQFEWDLSQEHLEKFEDELNKLE